MMWLASQAQGKVRLQGVGNWNAIPLLLTAAWTSGPAALTAFLRCDRPSQLT